MSHATQIPPGDHRATFGDLLKILRIRQRMTQQELGILLGYSAPHIARLESGERTPDPVMVKTRFIEALALQHEPELANQLMALAVAPRGTHDAFERASGDEATSIVEMPQSADIQLTNLPHLFSSFVGRQAEIARIKAALSQTRLLTLIGPGGSGKTRLAIEMAVTYQRQNGMTHGPNRTPDGIWIAELAPLTDGNQVADRIVQTLKLPQKSNQPLGALIGYLKPRNTLLILDNCEHVIQSCAELTSALLQACPRLSIVATSREGLNIPGEVIFQVQTLPIDDAIQLFCDRAKSSNTAFAPDDESIKAITRTCVQVDCIPLAIELVAARAMTMSMQVTARRLDKRLDLPNRGNRAAHPRHQTLRQLIDWSYDLLSVAERALFRRLAVFQGDFTLEATESICAEWNFSDEPGASNPIEIVVALVSKSLVQLDNQGAKTRYRLLETIREYAWEKLAAHGEVEMARHRHAEWCLSLATTAEAAFYRPERENFTDTLQREQSNIRAAMEWCCASDVTIGLRLVGALWQYWLIGGAQEYREGLRWAEAILQKAGTAAPQALRIPVILGAGLLRIELNWSDVTAAHYCEEALAYGRSSSNANITVYALEGLIRGELYGRRTIDPGEMIAQALDMADQTTAPAWFRAMTLNNMPNYNVLVKRDYQSAFVAAEKSYDLWRVSGDVQGILKSLIHLAQVSLYRVDFPQAIHYAETGLAVLQLHNDYYQELMLRKLLGEAWRYLGVRDQARATTEAYHALALRYDEMSNVASALELFGKIERDAGDYQNAWTFYAQGIHIYASDLDPWHLTRRLPVFISHIACLAVLRGHVRKAAYLFGIASGALKSTVHGWMAPQNRFEFAPYICATRQALSVDEFQAAYAEGEATPTNQMLAVLLAVLPNGADPLFDQGPQ